VGDVIIGVGFAFFCLTLSADPRSWFSDSKLYCKEGYNTCL